MKTDSKMHGRLKVKTSKEQEEERKIKEREKAYNFRHLSQRLFGLRPTIGTSSNLEEIFKLTTELLQINPDFYTVWNIRREALLVQTEMHKDEASTIWKNELSFTIDCLKKNEKSYSVWQHRIWILSNLPKSEYSTELILCNSFLAKDDRNFHCWDYRCYISDMAGTPIEEEFNFTTEKIRINFSNFSAWHRRHKLLIRGLTMPTGECPKSCDLRLIWLSEYDMILNALFTDPSDQSPWLYHNWLVKNNFGYCSQEQISKLETLQELEPDNRWVEQALHLSRKCLGTSE